MEAQQFDLIVLGAGPGGYTAALEAARLGLKTAIVEQDTPGGTCLARGCIPTKTLLHAAEIARQARENAPLGVHCDGVRVAMDELQQYKQQVVRQLSGGVETLLRQRGAALVRGTGRVTAPDTVEVAGAADAGDALLKAPRILIAAGCEPARLPLPGIDLPRVFNSTSMLAQTDLFPSLVIIGGGVIGMEFASLYAALGGRVTVLEAADRILAGMDREFGQNLKMILKKRGVDIHTGAALAEIAQEADGLCCRYTEKDAACEARGAAVLVAVGRRPCTSGLFAPVCAPAMQRGWITVDAQYATSVPGIWAIGDVTGGIQLAHAAAAQGLCAVAAMLGRPAPVRADVIPACVYTDPEIATVGLTADEAAARGIPAVCRRYPMGANGKTLLTRQERSLLKFVYAPDTGTLLGVQMMCARATDMIGEFADAVAAGRTVRQLAAAVRPHPTFNEAVWELARECAASLPEA